MSRAIRVVPLGRAARTFCAGQQSTASLKKGPIGYRAGDLVPSLAALIPQIPSCQSMKAAEMQWVTKSTSFFNTWQKIQPCMPKYEEFIKSHKGVSTVKGPLLEDIRSVRPAQQRQAMSEEAQAALGEFYLAVALQLRPNEIEAAGSDNEALLQVARKCAEEDFEPCIEEAQKFVADYSPALHQALEETCPLYEVDDGLFWRANFDVVAPAEFHHYLTALGHGSGQSWTLEKAHTSPKHVEKTVAEAKDALLSSNDMSMEPARRAGQIAYEKWLEASSMPVKASIAKTLMEHGFMIAVDIYQNDKLLPETTNDAGMMPRPLQASV